jgi:hypothetical protein
MSATRRLRNLDTGVVMEVSAKHADYLLTGGVNAVSEFVPGFELVDDDTPCGPPADVLAAAPPAGTSREASTPSEPEATPEGEQPEGEQSGDGEGGESEGEQPEGEQPEPPADEA